MQYIVTARYKTVEEFIERIMNLTSDRDVAYSHDVSSYNDDWEVWVEEYDTAPTGECSGLVRASTLHPKVNLYE